MRRFGHEDYERMAAAYAMGSSLRQIAAEFDCAKATVSDVMRKMGVVTAVSDTSPGRAEMVRRYQSGETYAEIGQALQVSASAVRRAVLAAGITPRPASVRPKPKTGKRRPPTLIERILAGIEIRDECWHWTGSTNRGTRGTAVQGRIQHDKAQYATHRVLWEHYHGPLGDARLVRLCGDERCCNPDHRAIFETDPWLRILAAMTVDPETFCWDCPIGGERGRTYRRGCDVHPHRLAYETWVEPIPPGHEVWRRCGSQRCINPDHLVARPQNTNRTRSQKPDSILAENDLLVSDLRCSEGHLMVGDAVYRVVGGGRRCVTCRNEYRAEKMAEPEHEPTNPRELFRVRRAAQLEAERMAETEARLAELLGLA